ncbi:ABC transporter ATP-binding protein [Methanococcoides sp.]|jgi:peptide/nickel transport system ATP-binding protein|uniref:ABC transporter ATP-binding protein n=1 Tax=Methanococcoides sp. TaxID=1966350 RepID=UPI00272EB9BB|nr:ABC transporter ATP-binding protein [Methanococcoides sp.]
MIKGVNLKKIYESGFFSKEETIAVEGVDIRIDDGETLSLVGGSGCGKSTLGKLLLIQTDPTDGKVFFKEKELTAMENSEIRNLRKNFQLIPQHPEDALDPRWEIRRSIAEPFLIQNSLTRGEIDSHVDTLIHKVGLQEEHKHRYPHELSGGELQRAVIARSIALNPDFIVCDEPTSMLDVSVQAAVLTLLKEVQKEYGMSFLFITHDLEVAKVMGDRIAVMYAGQIVEEGKGVFDNPLHPYTKMMDGSLKVKDSGVNFSAELYRKGMPQGCSFYHQCPERSEACMQPQSLRDVGGRSVRCIRCG